MELDGLSGLGGIGDVLFDDLRDLLLEVENALLGESRVTGDVSCDRVRFGRWC